MPKDRWTHKHLTILSKEEILTQKSTFGKFGSMWTKYFNSAASQRSIKVCPVEFIFYCPFSLPHKMMMRKICLSINIPANCIGPFFIAPSLIININLWNGQFICGLLCGDVPLEIMMHIVSFLYAMVELYFIKSNAVVTRSRSSELWL